MAVASLVGGAFLSASLQVLFDRLATREVLNLFSKGTSNVPDLLKKLKRKLILLNAVLDDADVKQFTDKTVRAWSDEARDAVYQADDLLSEVAYEALRCKVESDPHCQCVTIQVKSFSSSSSNSFDAHIEPKLKELIKLLKDLIKGAGFLCLREGVRTVHILTNRSSSESSSLVVESDMCGRDSEKEELIKLVLSDETIGTNNDVGVIPVVGMGGIGKTTLAQLVYNDDRVANHFELKAWVFVSQDFDVLRVTKMILESVTKYHCRSTDLNHVQEILKENLKGRKFLVVLDDVWNENYSKWDSFRTPFRTGASGCKIIVTTRIQDAASLMKTGINVNLTELSDDDCWSLFSKIAFDQRDPSIYPLLEGIGRKIVKRCRGLPLAAKSLAGLLRSKTPEEWDAVLKSEFWELPEDKSEILPALRLSYHYLPSHLKQCFAFCSLFPKNHEFREEEIVPMWIAHKYVLPQGRKNYEIEGKKYFRELLSMSFFQRHSRYRHSYFMMHDLIHDLAGEAAGQFSFRLDDEKSHEIPMKAHHFSFCPSRVNGFQQLRDAKEINSLRTFLPVKRYWTWGSKVRLDDVLLRQKHMRVLSLRHYSGTNELFDLIGSLIHLHYLDLSHTDIHQLPESFCKLHNLQTLLLINCKNLTSLPVEMGKLLSLRRLDFEGTNLTEMPMQMSQLEGLEYLTKFIVGSSSGLGIEGLKKFFRLSGKLPILGLENVMNSRDALDAKLKEKEYLETLHFVWGWCGVTDDSRLEREVLDYLRPHTNIKHLTVTRYRGTRFPDWLGDHSFCQMVSLHLEECNNCYELPPLGQLPCLKDLTVVKMSNVIVVGEEFYGSHSRTDQHFPSLETLRFKDMSGWLEWHIPGIGEFRKLCRLEMRNCPKLVGGLPRDIARIDILECPSLKASVPTWSSSVVADADTNMVLSGSPKIEVNWQGIMYGLLVRLYLSDLPSLNVLTSQLCTLTRLRELDIHNCSNLVSLSNMGLPAKLERLRISECELLQAVVDGMVSHDPCGSFWDLSIQLCPSLMSFADNGPPPLLKFGVFHACPKLEFQVSQDIESCCSSFEKLATQPKLFPSLQKLDIGYDDSNMACFLLQQGLENLTHITLRSCSNLKSLPDGIHNLLPVLERMELRDCPQIESFGACGPPSSLVELIIYKCEKLVSFRSGWGLQRLPSLQTLRITDAGESVESFPEEGLLPCTLIVLEMLGFRNMKTLDWRGIQHLTSLQTLFIRECPVLESLPEEGLPLSIRVLFIRGCPLLEPRCQKYREDWGKIAHIRNIRAGLF